MHKKFWGILNGMRMKLFFSFVFVIQIFYALLTPQISLAQTSQPVCGQELFQNKFTFCSLAQLHNNGTAPYGGCGIGEQCFIGTDVGNNECNWVIDNDGLKFCFGGFESQELLRSSRIEVRCTSNCGGAGIIGPSGAPPFAAGDAVQTHSNTNAQTASDGQGGVFSCVQAVGGFEQSVVDAINWQIDTASLACGVIGVGEFIGFGSLGGRLIAGAGGIVSRFSLPIRISTSASLASPIVQACLNLANQYSPTFETRVTLPNGSVACLKNQTIALSVDDQIIDPETGDILDSNGALFKQCGSGRQGIDTAIGCVPINDINTTTEFFLRWSLGVGGGISLFLISISAIKIMTTKGDPKRLQDARDTFSSAIAGLLLILLSVFVFRFISQNILELF